MKVDIPFKARFSLPMLRGEKTWTSRTRRYGKPGDTFEAFDNEFIIDKIERRTLWDVADHWKQEGCYSRQDFIDLWKNLHRKKGYLPGQRVYVHIFRRITI